MRFVMAGLYPLPSARGPNSALETERAVRSCGRSSPKSNPMHHPSSPPPRCKVRIPGIPCSTRTPKRNQANAPPSLSELEARARPTRGIILRAHLLRGGEGQRGGERGGCCARNVRECYRRIGACEHAHVPWRETSARSYPLAVFFSFWNDTFPLTYYECQPHFFNRKADRLPPLNSGETPTSVSDHPSVGSSFQPESNMSPFEVV
ncbi:hypothetical protein EDB92DRAFT_1863695 [Lactarius akahatsu]|uniref:Uncharacterized protein n=1 Tax=Lactarius akahatsu TaxID=416441 RepID=A0AAD4LEZ1_9AGAM|nr:hypothetical protein EDB92DRAFT_1863695 [Lactarius akahatsu]